ncbi:hypothetical protein ACHAWO_006209 [Cyclotella atomus]|jgi:hypothetical protein|uniref:Uncharacterized protein n=1 Tax=Cyclotella atomus TaxID=382360 RepID=A0ABD3PR38_9STRA
MERLHLAILLFLSSHLQKCHALSLTPVKQIRRTVCREKSITSSDEATANDSSYEALRRKFGLSNDPVVQIETKNEGASDVNSECVQTEGEKPLEMAEVPVLDNNHEQSPDEYRSSPLDYNQSNFNVPESSLEFENVIEDTDAEPHTPELGTIYSRKFSRYNIPLTIPASIAKDEMKREVEQRRERRLQRGVIVKLKSEPLANERGLFDGLLRRGKDMLSSSTSTKSIDPRIEKAYTGKSLRWITSDSHKSNTNSKSNLIDEEFVAAAAFWRMAAEISQTNDHDESKWYLALPETTSTAAQNLCDIINWHTEYLEKDKENDADKGIGMGKVLRARLDTAYSSSVPIVEFSSEYTDAMQQYIPSQDEQHTTEDTERRTKSWVQRLLVQLGICPFTKSNVKSGQGLGDVGVPVANIMYRHSNASHLKHGRSGEMYTLMADTWDAINEMISLGTSGKHGVSSILLSAPSFDDDFDLWSGPVFAMLEAGVTAIQAEALIGVVCFHPEYKTPDGSTFPGFGHMHSLPRLKKWYNEFTSSGQLSDNEIAAGGAWQRRTPHAVINVLRAEQLEAAEGRRESGILYERNIRVLVGRENGIGCGKLEEDLRLERSM